MRRKGERGQILVLFTLMLVALLGISALAIDVTGTYAEWRYERTVADAAALAGASDLYRQNSRVVDNTEWTNARTHAMQNLVNSLTGDAGVALPSCGGVGAPYASDVVNCRIPNTPYYASIKAPAPSCGPCDPTRSIQVTVRDPHRGLTFARIFGQQDWNVVTTSVAERSLGANYVFVTLRPPKPSRASNPGCSPVCDANENDIFLDGTNTKLVVHGDIGTNTNLELTNGATVQLDSGNYVYHYDAYKAWVGNPPDKQMSTVIQEPGYSVPSPPTASTSNYASESVAELSAADCKAEVTANVPAAYRVNPSDADTGALVCYKPGSYNFNNFGPPARVTTVIFTPGVYFLNGGLSTGNNVRVIGGYQPGAAGVSLVFPRTCSPACTFAGNTADLVSLNAGTAYPTGSGTPATGATNWDGSRVQTPGPNPLPITLIVQKDPNCLPVAPFDPAACQSDENQNRQLNLPGSGSLFLFGVQYAPTDNVQISGGSGSNGYLGQIWAWTVKYTGGSVINLVGATSNDPGVLRLAIACSPSAPCTNPEAAAAIP